MDFTALAGIPMNVGNTNFPHRAVGRWQYETTAPVIFDTIAGRVVVPVGFRFSIGAAGFALPPVSAGVLKASLLHDFLYDAWAGRVAGPYHADAAMMAEMKRHAVPVPLRLIVWLVISIWSATRSRDAAL